MMNKDLKRITDSLKELQDIGYFEYSVVREQHLNRDEKKDSRITLDKWRFKVQLTIAENDSLDVIAENIAKCYTECQTMEKMYLHKIKSPDLFEALESWDEKNKTTFKKHY